MVEVPLTDRRLTAPGSHPEVARFVAERLVGDLAVMGCLHVPASEALAAIAGALRGGIFTAGRLADSLESRGVLSASAPSVRDVLDDLPDAIRAAQREIFSVPLVDEAGELVGQGVWFSAGEGVQLGEVLGADLDRGMLWVAGSASPSSLSGPAVTGAIEIEWTMAEPIMSTMGAPTLP